MKKIAIILSVMTLAFTTKVKAQDDNMIFNHMSVGLSVGALDGFGIEVATPLTEYVNVRAGYGFFPGLKFTIDDVEFEDGPDKEYVDIDLKSKKNDFRLLFDIHPFKNSSFRVTLGAYIGNSELISAKNKDARPDLVGAYYKVGEKRFGFFEEGHPDEGYAKANIKIKSFRPYIGIGIGRAISKDKKFVVNGDLGFSFWGKPEIYAYNVWDQEFQEITKADIKTIKKEENKDLKDAFDLIKKFGVCPTLSVRFVYNIF